MQQRIHTIYTATSPSGKQYIGITINYASRLRGHRFAMNKGSTYPIHKAMRKYGQKLTFAPIASAFSLEYAYQLEKQFITEFNTFQPKGYNQTLGGEGAIGFKRSMEQKDNHRKVMTGKRWKLSEEAKRNIGKAKLGHKNPNYGKTTSLKQKQAATKGKILCVETGVVYASASDAARQLGLISSCICWCVLGRRKTHGKFTWRRF